MTPGTDAPLQVFTDGQCPLCRWMRARVETYDRDRRLLWLDYNEPEVALQAAPRTASELAAAMHVRNSAGEWSSGFGAWVQVLRVLPAWRWLTPVLSRWPLTRVGPVVYRWIASHRYTLFGVPPPCDASGVCQLHKRA